MKVRCLFLYISFLWAFLFWRGVLLVLGWLNFISLLSFLTILFLVVVVGWSVVLLHSSIIHSSSSLHSVLLFQPLTSMDGCNDIFYSDRSVSSVSFTQPFPLSPLLSVLSALCLGFGTYSRGTLLCIAQHRSMK